MNGPTRWSLGSLFAGLTLWFWAILRIKTPSAFGIFGSLLLFAPLVLLPLVLLLFRAPDRNGEDSLLYKSIVVLQPFSAIAALLSFFLEPGLPAALLASGWFLFTLLLGLFGLLRLLSRGLAPIEECCIDVGSLYFAVGGFWVVLSRGGLQPLEFNPLIVLLTAIHFHYAGGLLQIIAGLTGRVLFAGSGSYLPRRLYRLIVCGVIAGPPLLAAGITLSPFLEGCAALLLAGSVLLLGFLTFSLLLSRNIPFASKFLLAVASGSTTLSMGLALLYAWGEWTGQVIVNIAFMAKAHGIANSVGFALCSLLAFILLKPASRARRAGIPFSRLSSWGSTGPDFFHRIGAYHEGIAPSKMPQGLVDRLDEYRRSDFDPQALHPSIRAFYERTRDYDLSVTPHWRSGFRLMARIYRRWAERMGQMCLPLSAQGKNQAIRSAILPLRDEVDGRRKVRAWVRTYETGHPVYVAAYASHEERGQTYMNIAFPLPGGNITSILKLEAIPLETNSNGFHGLSLTSWSQGSLQGDEGVYYATKWFSLRLPINETIRVWTAGREKDPFALEGNKVEDMTLVARHAMWFLGIRFLTLDYTISLKEENGLA